MLHVHAEAARNIKNAAEDRIWPHAGYQWFVQSEIETKREIIMKLTEKEVKDTDEINL